MLNFIEKLRGRESMLSNERGSALVVCMLVLVTVTTLAILNIQTSVTETHIATNEQRWEEDFNLSEGGTGVEATNVGYARDGVFDWYEISDPDAWGEVLIPPDDANFDPGDDMADATPRADFEALSEDEKKMLTAYWPRQNLEGDTTDNTLDFAYLVTYLGASPQMIKAYDASGFAAYQFRVDAAKRIVVEIGGLKIGVKQQQ